MFQYSNELFNAPKDYFTLEMIIFVMITAFEFATLILYCRMNREFLSLDPAK